MDEQRWIENILAGDTQSFSCLVTKYQQMAFSIAFRILENREEAEEAVQDSYVKMYRALPTFQFGSKFSTWFYRIVYHTSLSALRQQRLFSSYDDATPADLTDDDIDSATEILQREDRKEIITKVLKKMPKDEALLLSLYYLEECSIDEIRQITELTTSNIKVKLFRGRKHFYESLQKIAKHEIVNMI